MASDTGLLPKFRRPAISAPPPTIQNMMKPRNASSETSRSPAAGRMVDAACASDVVCAALVGTAAVDMGVLPARRFYRVTARNKTFPSGVRHVEGRLRAGFASRVRVIKVKSLEVESMFRCATALLSFAALCGAASLEWPQW